MIWMYRLQQRLAITKTESNLLLAFTLFLMLGFSWRYVQAQQYPALTSYIEAEHQLTQASTAFQSIALTSTTRDPKEAQILITSVVADSQRVAEPSIQALPLARMNINTATASQLDRLPRIGPKMAERIITYRSEHGAFRRVEDLTQVRGIGEKTLAKLKPLIFVEATK